MGQLQEGSPVMFISPRKWGRMSPLQETDRGWRPLPTQLNVSNFPELLAQFPKQLTLTGHLKCFNGL